MSTIIRPGQENYKEKLMETLVCAPLSPLQAFWICLMKIIQKLAADHFTLHFSIRFCSRHKPTQNVTMSSDHLL